jgi:integrase
LSERINDANLQNNNPRQQQVALTFADFASGLWLTDIGNKRVKPSTIYSYDAMLTRHLLPAFGALRLDRITTVHLTRFFNGLQGNVAPKYALNIYGLLNTMFEVAVQHDLIAISPVRRKLHRPEYERKEKPALSAAQVRRVIDSIAEPSKPLFVVLALTGLRIGEALGLRWQEIISKPRR